MMNSTISDASQLSRAESAAATHTSRVCIIGCGNVGAATAFALVQSAAVREIVLIDHTDDKAVGEAMDLQQAAAVPTESFVKVSAGDYKDAATSSIVVITAGVASSDAGESRLDLLDKNAKIVREIVGKLKAENFKGILLVTTNPVDVLAQIAWAESGLPANQVIGTGTVIDTARLRALLAEELAVEPGAINAFIIGEHGDSEIAVWSAARVAGLPLNKFPGADKLPTKTEMLDRVRRAAPEIVERKGHTAFAIALSVRRICEAILRNERAALAVSTRLTGQYAIENVFLGTPCIVGKTGVEQVIELDLNADEQSGLLASAEVLRESIASQRR